MMSRVGAAVCAVCRVKKVNRPSAEFKLLEALEVFGIVLPSHGVALDLAAAPGGWTRVLRRAGEYVTAIDPGELDAPG